MLLVALEVHESGLCACGHPVDEAWDPDGPTSYESHKEVCRACAAREAAEESEGKRPHGRKTWVSDNQRMPDEVDEQFAPVFERSGDDGLDVAEGAIGEVHHAEDGAAEHGAE